MNLAFPALIISLLVLPGIFFWYSYRRGADLRSPVALASFSEELAVGFFWCLPIHLLAWLIVCALGFTIKYDLVLSLMANPADHAILTQAAASTSSHSGAIIGYFLGINVMAVGFGIGLHRVVVWSGLDNRFNLLRFPNEWYYLFDDVDPPADLVYISAVVNEGGKAVIYWGILADYFFNKDGELDRLYLQNVEWAAMQINADEQQPGNRAAGPGHPIEGDYFVLRYADILNLNVEHIRIRPQNGKRPRT